MKVPNTNAGLAVYMAGCLYLMEKVSWSLGVSVYEDMEFYTLLLLKIKDRGRRQCESMNN